MRWNALYISCHLVFFQYSRLPVRFKDSQLRTTCVQQSGYLPPVIGGAIDKVPSIERITFLLVSSEIRGRIMCLHAMMRFHHRAIHMATFSSSHAAPTGNLRKKIAELEKIRKLGKKRNPKKDDFIVYVPESLAFLDTASMPMVLTAVAVALFAKVLMMYDESKAQEMIERKIQHAPPEQGTVRMLSREEWDEIQEIRPRTPFESKLARPNARLRTGEPLRMEDVKDWTIDVLTDALARAEETVRRGTK